MAGLVTVITDLRHGVVGIIVPLLLIPKTECLAAIPRVVYRGVIRPRGHAIWALGVRITARGLGSASASLILSLIAAVVSPPSLILRPVASTSLFVTYLEVVFDSHG
jgi:hypothetical protein